METRRSTFPAPFVDADLTDPHRNSFYVPVRRIVFGVSWLLFALIHESTAAFFAAWAWAYWKLPATFLGISFATYRISLPLSDFPILAACHMAVAFSHAWLLIQMVVWSIWYMRLSFHRRSHRPTRRNRTRRQIRTGKWIVLCLKRALNGLEKIFGRQGFLGIEGQYFELVYIVREIAETVLQSLQAYRTSMLISGTYINRIYAIMIFTNCCTTPIALYFLEHNPPLARFVCLLLDIALDFITTVAIPLTLVFPYLDTYDPQSIEPEPTGKLVLVR